MFVCTLMLCRQAHLSEWARLPGAKLQPLPLHTSRGHAHSVLSREGEYSLYQTASESDAFSPESVTRMHALVSSSVDNEGEQDAEDEWDIVAERIQAGHIRRLV